MTATGIFPPCNKVFKDLKDFKDFNESGDAMRPRLPCCGILLPERPEPENDFLAVEFEIGRAHV